ncbi:MAG: twin-arginine translocase TatA/TatE family subunit [Deltaproteobacteria bacterium]|nr:twin-arginine translocase TatA/TatE family subunit [Deltaproteobacteria bacterium]
MFGMGAGELILILVVALLIFGPKKLPELAKGIGKALREFRRASTDLQEQLSVDQEIGAAGREVQAAAAGAPSPSELQAARQAYDVAPQPAVPAAAPGPAGPDSPALEAIKAAAAARVAAEIAAAEAAAEAAAPATPVETQSAKPAIAPAPGLAPAPDLDSRPAIAPAPSPASPPAATPAGGEAPAKG